MFDIKNADELIRTGNIVQDGDTSVDWPEREARFNRYIELLDSIEGTEGLEVACLILRSMRARDDYGAYQTAQRSLFRFPPFIAGKGLVEELPPMISENREWAGEILCGLANEASDEDTPYIDAFLEALEKVQPSVQSTIERFVTEQENGGWLDHRKGVLRRKGRA